METTDLTTTQLPSSKKNFSPGNCDIRNKLDTYDWLAGLRLADDEIVSPLVEVRFKNTRKGFYRNPEKFKLSYGDKVVVESTSGYDLGTVGLISTLVTKQIKVKGNEQIAGNILRMPTEADLNLWEESKRKEVQTKVKARQICRDYGLQMKINDVEYQADNKKATFYYSADGRVDFRELIKDYARNFKVKIEMRQIGIRQEAGRVGGIGECGREICCSCWLTDFNTVPTIAAKQQNLYLNPAKLSGQCGRLKCCLNYELDAYLEAFESFPDEGITIKTEKGDAKVAKIDILNKILWFTMVKDPEAAYWPISVDNTHKIIEMNKNKKYPPDLATYAEKNKAYNLEVAPEDRYQKEDYQVM